MYLRSKTQKFYMARCGYLCSFQCESRSLVSCPYRKLFEKYPSAFSLNEEYSRNGMPKVLKTYLNPLYGKRDCQAFALILRSKEALLFAFTLRFSSAKAEENSRFYMMLKIRYVPLRSL